MARKYAAGNRALAECQRSGRIMLLRNTVKDGHYRNLIVDPAWYEPKHPLERLPTVDDPVALNHPAPENSTDSRVCSVKFPLYDLASDATVGRINLTGTAHDPATDTIMAALYDAVPTFSTYSTEDEVTGTGYTAGGKQLVFTQETVGGEVRSSAADTQWLVSSFTAQSVVLYNASQADAVIAILPFGNPRTTTGTFSIEWASPLFTDRS